MSEWNNRTFYFSPIRCSPTPKLDFMWKSNTFYCTDMSTTQILFAVYLDLFMSLLTSNVFEDIVGVTCPYNISKVFQQLSHIQSTQKKRDDFLTYNISLFTSHLYVYQSWYSYHPRIFITKKRFFYKKKFF